MNFSIKSNRKTKSAVEMIAQAIFVACAFMAVAAVLSITLYMVMQGTPAIFQVGLKEILFGTVWAPEANDGASFG